MPFYKKTASIILTIIMLFSFCACGKSVSTKIDLKDGKQDTVSSKYTDSKYHVTNDDKLDLISKSGLVQMYLDKQTYSIVIKETSLKNVWHSLPLSEVKDSAVLSLKVSKNGKMYELNSQDNSVAYGKAKYEKKDDGVWITYTICDKEKDPTVSVPVTVKYTLIDGSLYVDINCEKFAGKQDYKVESVELLKYFGANKGEDKDGFIVVPDGCGAKIKTGVSKGNKNFDYKIYNQDYSIDSKKLGDCVIPTFGIKNGKGAFGAIIRKGDSLATVRAKKAKSGGYNCAYPEFTITPTKTEKGKKGTEKFVSEQSYNGDISVCYRFLSGTSATYSGIAAVCREQLVRDTVLSTKIVKETGTCPVNVNYIGVSKSGVLPKDKLTQFEQALIMTQLLKAKGINDLNINYKAALTKGIGQSNISDAKLIGKLGSDDNLNEFYDYVSTQEFNLFFDINILTMKGGACASNIKDKKTEVDIENPLNKYFKPKKHSRYLVEPSKLEKNVNKFLTNMKNVPSTGYSISDAGSILYSDFNDDLITREKLKSIISDQVITMSTNRKTMTNTGNFYMLKNIDYINEIPMQTTYKENDYYEGIPFIQMVLHGIVEYSGIPVNLEKNYQDALLNSIEYGALLSYDMAFVDLDDDDKGKNVSLYYQDWMTKISESYDIYNNLFEDIRDSKMTDHYVPVKDLSCTVYDNGSYIYVNHSDKDIKYNNLVIKAKNYLRVN